MISTPLGKRQEMTGRIFKEIPCKYERGQSMKSDYSAQVVKWPDRVVQAYFQYYHCETQILNGFSSLTWLWGEKSLCPVCVLFPLMQVVPSALEAFVAQDFPQQLLVYYVCFIR